jgi:glycosyltransferase involved in cell wall biosynthesis
VLNGKRLAVVLPAYNAATTLARTLEEIDRSVVDDILLVDDASTDATVDVASRLGLDPIRHNRNRGYGANQKTCYRSALERGADIVVMVHPDYQYSPRLIVPIAAMIAYGEYDLVLGSRILAQSAILGGMPRYKYVANRLLTLFENIVVQSKLSEFHSGLRAFSCELLRSLPIELNSDDFVFDNEILLQAMAAGARIGEVSCPTRYATDSSSINFRRSVTYGMGVVRASVQYRLHRWGVYRARFLELPITPKASTADAAGELNLLAPPTPNYRRPATAERRQTHDGDAKSAVTPLPAERGS